MGDGFGIGSLAAFLVDFIDNQPKWQPEIRFEPVDYETYIHSPEWEEKAKEAKKRAGYRCQLCNGKYKIAAHHRTYERLGHELPEDLTVLCKRCHKLFYPEVQSKPHATIAIPF